jgi:hypothetical protein
MTASSQFGEFELDRSRFELRHKGDNSRVVATDLLTSTERPSQNKSSGLRHARKSRHSLTRRCRISKMKRLESPGLVSPE